MKMELGDSVRGPHQVTDVPCSPGCPLAWSVFGCGFAQRVSTDAESLMVALFVLKLVAGITLMWLLMPRKDVTDGFFRIQMLVALGLSVLLVLMLDVSSLTGNGISAASEFELQQARATIQILKGMQLAVAVIAYAGHIFWKLGRRGPGRITIFLLAGLCIGSLVLHSWHMASGVPAWLQVVSDLSSAAVLGATITGMLLGHWYLTTPTMSIQPLTWFAKALFVAALVRLFASGFVLAHFGWTATDTTYTLWLSMRLIGGIAVPLATSLMVVRILRYRNTQSATGVLFAGLILVFMGEMTAALLERALRIPF